MPPRTEYCLSNVTAEARACLTDAPVEAAGLNCLEHCGHCYRTPFLVVDGEFVAGDSHDRLLADATGAGEP